MSTERESLDAIRDAMRDPNVALYLVPTFGHGTAVRVKVKTRKIGPLLFPAEGQDIADVLHMLGTMAVESMSAAERVRLYCLRCEAPIYEDAGIWRRHCGWRR